MKNRKRSKEAESHIQCHNTRIEHKCNNQKKRMHDTSFKYKNM